MLYRLSSVEKNLRSVHKTKNNPFNMPEFVI